MKLSNLKRVIAEELTRLGTSKLKKGRGCGPLNEAEEMPGKCYASMGGESYYCGKRCTDVEGCGGEMFNHPLTGESGVCECDTPNVGMVGRAPIRR